MSVVELSKGEYADLVTSLIKQVRDLKKERDEFKAQVEIARQQRNDALEKCDEALIETDNLLSDILMNRRNCIKHAFEYLKKRGIINDK
jgi:predicted  nucleic acid-binding Zn-ribbon protein